jgi:SAM-dependent methyltransferase
VAATYHLIRPRYPTATFDALFALLPERPSLVEVGPGTGQATRDLLARGATVVAVELGPSLAAVLRDTLPSDDLEVVVGDFEQVDLGDRRFDGVVSACAYHWIPPLAQASRPAELLRPGGIVGIISLIQVASPDDLGFFAASQPIYERYGEPHTGPLPPQRHEAVPDVDAVLRADPRFDDVTHHAWDWNQTYTSAQYRMLMDSYSGTQLMEPSLRAGLLDDMQAFVDAEFGGFVTRPLVVTLTTARRVQD